MISVVIPTLNAEAHLAASLSVLVEAAVDGLVREVIVVDGGSTDRTATIADDAGTGWMTAKRGRGSQLAAGCATARGDWLLALHADTRLNLDWPIAAQRHIRERPDCAGYFRFRLDDNGSTARVWERGVALRCALFALPFGDQGLLISRALYASVGGYPQVPLMEDVAMADRLTARRLRPIDADAITSADRYRRDGYLSRAARNAWLLTRYRLGASPERLARAYG